MAPKEVKFGSVPVETDSEDHHSAKDNTENTTHDGDCICEACQYWHGQAESGLFGLIFANHSSSPHDAQDKQTAHFALPPFMFHNLHHARGYNRHHGYHRNGGFHGHHCHQGHPDWSHHGHPDCFHHGHGHPDWFQHGHGFRGFHAHGHMGQHAGGPCFRFRGHSRGGLNKFGRGRGCGVWPML